MNSHFCSGATKRRMMEETGERLKKGLLLTLTMLGTAAMTMAFAFSSAQAHDYSDHPLERETKIPFTVDSSDKFNPSYSLIWDAMQPLYNGTIRDKTRKDAVSPIIGNSQIDLNGDGNPEIIAYHVESEEEKGTFCKKNGLCPFYIFDMSGKKVRTLGIIFAGTIDRGDDIKNGYWTLKAFTTPGDLEHATPYAYNLSQKKYLPLE